ncbi:MAG: hypothetical protein AB1706_17105 [Pseudomonadota bacterium]
MIIKEDSKFNNIISIATYPTGKFSLEEIKMMAELIADGADIKAFDWKVLGSFKNRVMDAVKLSMLTTLWDSATKLLVTNQTTSPVGDETTPMTGIIYTATSNQEVLRRVANPYRICYQITDETANGLWGSLVWTTSADSQINRVRVPIQKPIGKSVFIELRAQLV